MDGARGPRRRRHALLYRLLQPVGPFGRRPNWTGSSWAGLDVPIKFGTKLNERIAGGFRFQLALTYNGLQTANSILNELSAFPVSHVMHDCSTASRAFRPDFKPTMRAIDLRSSFPQVNCGLPVASPEFYFSKREEES